ncbi:triacylglycerol lipase [Ancylostoma caninum]|uniref:Triacylglycerol lipase n=1 Tax=Ancylostoma caninum TaxID=29170 RepID=A0A368FAE7_ANCCA|nr:triacylglycerol lipase [Ancylostoma caninum]
MQLVEEANWSAFHRKAKWVAGGYVSTYFYNAFMAVWNGGLKESFEALLATYPNYNIWVTGHSLGASMASLAASYVVARKSISGGNVKLITYGQPRTGDAAFAASHNRLTFYPYNMEEGCNFTICHADESRRCSDGLLYDLSVYDHLHYFNMDVSKYGVDGCTGAGDGSFSFESSTSTGF